MNFIRVTDMTVQDIKRIFTVADSLRTGGAITSLSGRTAVMFFPESSIRTRITFEKGLHCMGITPILFPSSALDKREDIADVTGYIENWADLLIIRHPSIEKIESISKCSQIPVINAMTSQNHPCEILSDIYSIRDRNTNYSNLAYTFVGENSNILHSWIEASEVFGFRLNHVSLPENEVDDAGKNYFFFDNLNDIISHTDVLLTDPLTEKYRNEEYYRKFQITLKLLQKGKNDLLFNPCPPFYRGEEVSSDAISSEYFVGYSFKKNLLYVQQAIMAYVSETVGGLL